MYYIIIIGLLTLISGLSIYIAIIQHKKSKKYKDLYDNIFDELEEIETSIQSVLITIKTIDESGAFESDDEIGAVFDSLKTIITNHFKPAYEEEEKK